MKKLFLGSAALVALGLGAPAAFAAERPVPAYAPPPPPPPAYTWNGCYAGASAGTSSGNSQHFDAAGNAITNEFDLSGFIGGGQLGCNWQWGAWVFGIEGDGSAVNKSGQAFEFSPPRPLVNWISETQERWFVTARGRLGLTNFWWFGDKTMVYVTGGGAWAKIDASEWLTTATGPQTQGHQESNTRSGWTVGGGIEYALGYGWSVKSEFLYADFGTFRTFTSPPFGTANIFPRDVKVKDYIWRAGMNYKFW